MRDALVQVYLHFIWGTWDRLPLITPALEKIVYAAIIDECEKMNCSVIAIGGTQDHVHLFIKFPSTISIANFIKGVKGSTSHLVTHKINPTEFFKWQGAYAVYSVNEKDFSRIKYYIQHQKEHHENCLVEASLEL